VPSITDAILTATPDPTRPMLTFYDDKTGERTELSALTLGNWAAKTANYFRDELGVARDDTIIVDLPEHWQTVAILLGAWWAGATVAFAGEAAEDARVVVTSLARLDDYADAEELVIASLDPFGMGAGDLPVGVADFGPSVRVHSDNFTPGTDAAAALRDRSPSSVLEDARGAADAAGIGRGDRVLTTRTWNDAETVVANLIGPLTVGAGLVVVAHPDEERIAARAQTERATTTLR